MPKDAKTRQLRRERNKELAIVRRATKRGAKKVRHRHLQRAQFFLRRLRHHRAYLKAKKSGKGFETWMLNGHPNNIEPEVRRVIVRAVAAGLVVTATTNGNHVTGSYHYPSSNPKKDGKGRAVDLAGSAQKMRAFTAQEFKKKSYYNEFFGPPNTQFVKGGKLYSGSIPNHYDHNHASPKVTYK